MSKFDSGKHMTGKIDNDTREEIRSDKRLDAQRTPKTTAARQAAFDSEKLGNVGNGAFNRPGSQNKNK